MVLCIRSMNDGFESDLDLLIVEAEEAE